MNTRISLSGEVLEEVGSFVYLGSIYQQGLQLYSGRQKEAGNGKIGNAVIIINMEKQRYFYNHKSQAAKSIGLVSSNLWE